jgi:hypothetical protein
MDDDKLKTREVTVIPGKRTPQKTKNLGVCSDACSICPNWCPHKASHKPTKGCSRIRRCVVLGRSVQCQ